MATSMQDFTTLCAGLIKTSILGPICEHLNGKGVTVTVDELMKVLQMPVARTPGVPSAKTVPAMAYGGTTKASTKAATTVDEPTDGLCKYQFKRGVNREKYCGREVKDGGDYCSSCRKTMEKTKAKAKPEPKVTPGVAPNKGAVPRSVPGVAVAQPEPSSIKVVNFDPEQSLYRDLLNNFILHTAEDSNDHVVVGIVDSKDSKEIRSLTPQERTTALARGLKISDLDVETDTDEQTEQQPSPPVIPAPVRSRTVPEIPSIPTITPSVGAIPSIPHIPTRRLAK